MESESVGSQPLVTAGLSPDLVLGVLEQLRVQPLLQQEARSGQSHRLRREQRPAIGRQAGGRGERSSLVSQSSPLTP